jgi:hypothetical protein
MLRLLVLFLFTFACSCRVETAAQRSRYSDVPQNASFSLFDSTHNASFCGATRLERGRFVTANHCVDEGLQPGDFVADAVGMDGFAVELRLEQRKGDRDVAFLVGEPDVPYAVVGTFNDGKAVMITPKARKNAVFETRIGSLDVVKRDGSTAPQDFVAQSARRCSPGESGSGVFQNEAIVGVVIAWSPSFCYMTVLK